MTRSPECLLWCLQDETGVCITTGVLFLQELSQLWQDKTGVFITTGLLLCRGWVSYGRTRLGSSLPLVCCFAGVESAVAGQDVQPQVSCTHLPQLPGGTAGSATGWVSLHCVLLLYCFRIEVMLNVPLMYDLELALCIRNIVTVEWI